MDVETTQAIEDLGSRIDRLEAEMREGFSSMRAEMRADFLDVRAEMRVEFADVRTEMRRESLNVRTEMVGLREDLGEELRSGLDSNWTRTQTLFESLRGDVQLLAGHVANLAARGPK